MKNIKLLVNGSDVTSELLKQLSSIVITDRNGNVSDTVTFLLQDKAGELEPPTQWNTIELSIDGLYIGKYETSEYKIDAYTGAISITALAADTSTQLKAQRCRTHETLTLGELVEKIAGEHGYNFSVAESLKGINLGHINQDHESDQNLLTRIAEKINGVFKVSEGVIIFATNDGKDAQGEYFAPLNLSDINIDKCSLSGKVTKKFNSIRTKYFNENTNCTVYVVAGSGEPCKEVNTQYKTYEDASRAASSILKEHMTNEETMRVETNLNFEMIAGRKVAVSNQRKGFNGDWMIETATHTIAKDSHTLTVLDLKKA